MQSGRQTVRRLIIFRRTPTVRARQPFYFGRRTHTPGHLILGVFAQFSGV